MHAVEDHVFTTLISAPVLALQSEGADWVVVDCRHDLADPTAGIAAYVAGHIPGARFASIDTDLSDKKNSGIGPFRGRHPLPSQDAFLETLRSFGIDDTTQVIAYDSHGGMFAARLWWMMRWVGHCAVAVLDGGLPAWKADGQRLEIGMRAKAEQLTGTVVGRPSLASTLDVARILDNLDRPVWTVVDARSPDRFRGENETLDPIGGHIPGAINRFFKQNLAADGRFKTSTVLRAEFDALIDAPTKAVMQCGSGVTACHNLLAMEIAKLPGAALYPGSWSEWCSDPRRPVATGQ